jgi:hypothetical protein
MCIRESQEKMCGLRETLTGASNRLRPSGLVDLKEDVLSGLVRPGDRDDLLFVDGHGGIVDVPELRLVHTPRALVRGTRRDLDPFLPCHP